MISVEQARKIILRNILPLNNPEVENLTSCLGRVSALDIKSKENIPPFNNSAMDGFAMRAKDSRGASNISPKILEVIEDVPAGYVSKKVVRLGQAIRIMTGAPLHKGADSVVMVEDTIQNKEFMQIFKEAKKGENVRYAGEDVKKGEVVIKKGAILKSGHIGMLASLVL